MEGIPSPGMHKNQVMSRGRMQNGNPNNYSEQNIRRTNKKTSRKDAGGHDSSSRYAGISL